MDERRHLGVYVVHVGEIERVLSGRFVHHADEVRIDVVVGLSGSRRCGVDGFLPAEDGKHVLQVESRRLASLWVSWVTI